MNALDKIRDDDDWYARCPECGSTNIEFVDRSLLFGEGCPDPDRRVWHCEDCDAVFNPQVTVTGGAP